MHVVEPVNDTVLDQSVSCSLLDETRHDTGKVDIDSMEHKTSTDFYQEVSNVKQSSQFASTGRKRLDRDSDTEEKEDKGKKLSLTAALCSPHQDHHS